MNDKNINVLLIEDNPGDTRLIREMLDEDSDFPFNLEHADRLSTGLERLAEKGIDVILLDLSLPEAQGLDTFYKVFSQASNVPIIVLTVHDDEVLAVQAMQKGAQDYLVKGKVDTNLLLRTIRYAIVRKRAEGALQESNRHLEDALAELKSTQQQILQQERLRALGEMASGIAHDFNNALSPIMSFSEILLTHPENLDDKEKVTRYLVMINTAAKDAANVVRRLRQFYQKNKDTDTFQSVNLKKLVEEAISLTQPKWKDEAQANGKTVHIETHLQEVPFVSGNEADLREVMTNLIFNAVDAISESGMLILRTYPEDNHVVLEVSDTGTGMTEEARRRCMDPFFTTKDQRGTGFGLAIVYNIIQRHKGTVVIESEWGKGTTFILQLPIQKEQREEERKDEVEAPSRSLHVLVVEDEPLVCEGMIAYLTSDGHTVETATNGHEGLEKFQAGKFDLVLTDRAMPEMSGDQLAAAIKEIEPNKPIILLTGFGDSMTNTYKKPDGVDFIMNKPVTLIGLRKALASLTENPREAQPSET